MENENTNHPDEKKSLRDDFDDSATPLDENFDDSKVKFLNGKQGLDDSHVVVEVPGSDISFNGLGKEELMQYATDPFWVRTRKILFVLFWLGWIGMLVAAILIIVLAPRCPERPDLKWYQTDVVYQINPKSFKDSSEQGKAEAGTGDFAGIASKVGYLETLGINTFWINSFYKSDGLYDGNDVVDHKKVDEVFGSMEAFESLRKTTKKKGMKMIVDFIPNHTGKKHLWFVASQKKEAKFADYYIWADGVGGGPPNNWKTAYGESAWTKDTVRNQYYYHSYLPEYPDLNLRNPDVLNQLDGILTFWLEKGVDGFAVQGLQRLIETNETSQAETNTGDLTVDQNGNLKIVERWRNIINSFSDKPGRERVLIATIKPSGNNTQDYYKHGIHIITSEALTKPENCDFDCLKTELEHATEKANWRGWMLDDDSRPRFFSVGSETFWKAYQALHLLLPGTPMVYYGDEIAMTNGVITANQSRDPLYQIDVAKSRDIYRTPMLWSQEDNAGFCAKDVTPWLPVNLDYRSKNVQFSSAHMVGYTMYKSFIDLVKLRAKESFQFGSFAMIKMQDIVYFTRKAEGFPGYVVVVNTGGKSAHFKGFAESMTVVYASNGEKVGTTFDTKNSPLGFNKEGEVFIFEYE